jgi:hypothetical protein
MPTHPIVQELELSHVAHTEILLLVQGDDSSCFCDINPDRTPQGIRFCLFTARRIVYAFNHHLIGSALLEILLWGHKRRRESD